jgi:UDP-2,3-diacylglucosamine pyrophosphatase LpxH
VITNIESDRLVVISDLHLGNPFSTSRAQVIDFLHWAANSGYDVCINGDGLEMAQASLKSLVRDVPDFFQALSALARKGRRAFYIVGNHDMVLENFLDNWGGVQVVPFLNVRSGAKRIRIEHGHLYDPFFVNHPELYEFLTWFGGFFLKIHPKFYKIWIRFEKFRLGRRFKKTGIVGEPPQFKEAALELARRGFDTVIFGHTHHIGESELGPSWRYINPGSWMLTTHYVAIENGSAELKLWQK